MLFAHISNRSKYEIFISVSRFAGYVGHNSTVRIEN